MTSSNLGIAGFFTPVTLGTPVTPGDDNETLGQGKDKVSEPDKKSSEIASKIIGGKEEVDKSSPVLAASSSSASSSRAGIRAASTPPIPLENRGHICAQIKRLREEISQLKKLVSELEEDEALLQIESLKSTIEERTSSLNGLLLPRKYPKALLIDTGDKGRPETATCFFDEEILQVHRPVRRETVTVKNRTREVMINENGKHVIQQIGIRACTVTSTAMLIRDHGAMPCEISINFGTPKVMHSDIVKAGLTPICSDVRNIEALKRLLEANGSAIVGIDDYRVGGMRGHAIIVDEIRDNGVRIRDPYHGWDITVTFEAFQRLFYGITHVPDLIIQIQTTKSQSLF